ncbi:hypothetical protein [Sulfurospirillum barnesii]|uniref:Uncharacterized protein n=1 Tax=Sulfurospirillum barnesii (strain ATCC 700032 / DSM 10660 / SES-3) TaxID=760154 RepID=I3XV89_SULBS|nr:hypothetical protein [Sulfurospirillum barnesii]AFL67863.1 hypothetical protein Sulba_0554 [Sulfurospirillum barnesii SES-3]
MTVDESKIRVNTFLQETLNTIATKNKEVGSAFSSILESEITIKQKSSSNDTPIEELASSSQDEAIEAFKEALRTKGALQFYQDYNFEKIEKMIEEKKAELMDKLGLGENTQPPLVGEERANALALLEDMLDAYRKQLQEKMQAEDELKQQTSTLTTFLKDLA